jgi:hypothetical protein
MCSAAQTSTTQSRTLARALRSLPSSVSAPSVLAARSQLTIRAHAIQTLGAVLMRMQRRPRRDMNLLAQTHRMVLQQRLHVLPARERADFPHAFDVNDVVQACAAGVPKYRPFHVRGLQFAALHQDLACGRDGALRDVERVVLVFREAQHDGDARGARYGADARHVGRGVGEGVFDVRGC